MNGTDRFYPRREDPSKMDVFEKPHSVTLGELPPAALDSIKAREAALFQGEELPELTDPQVIEHKDNTKTYIVRAVRPLGRESGRKEATYFVDVVSDDLAGFGEVYLVEEVFDKPYVGNINTEAFAGGEIVTSRGLAQRRYRIMRNFTEATYGESLHSGVLNEVSHRYWEKRVSLGIAERTGRQEGPGEFRFKRLDQKEI